MARVFSAQQRGFDSVIHVAVAISAVTPHQRHIGILYRDADSGRIRMLHLAWHYQLRCDEPRLHYLWIDPPIHAARLRNVAAICRKVWRANQRGIPYAFSHPSGCFDADTGRFLIGSTRHGLTCSTFVLAVFQRAGLLLLDYDTWPRDRPGDREWKEFIVGQLRSGSPPAGEEHVEAVRTEMDAVRFRPEEVGGAVTNEIPPAVSFDTACVCAARVLQRLGR